MAPSYSERQAQYAAWRDRLRPKDDVSVHDDQDTRDRWDTSALFQPAPSIDLDADETVDVDVDADSSDQRA